MKKAVGIYNGEIFIADLDENDKFGCFYVLRYVEKSRLEDMHDFDTFIMYYAEDYKWMWKDAVAADMTEESFEDWMERIFDEEDDGEEMFVGKDDSFVDYLSDEEREKADAFILESEDVEVGTWECSGWYTPDGDFDFVFDEELAKKYYEERKKDNN